MAGQVDVGVVTRLSGVHKRYGEMPALLLALRRPDSGPVELVGDIIRRTVEPGGPASCT